MRNSFLPSLLLLGSLTLPCWAQSPNTATAQPPGLEAFQKDMAKASTLLRYWANYGCYKKSDQTEPNVKEQCKEACFPGGIKSDVPASQAVQSSQTCWFSGPEVSGRTGKPLTAEDKKHNPRLGEHPFSITIAEFANESFRSDHDDRILYMR